MADNTVKNRYAALIEGSKLASTLNEEKHKDEYASKIRSYYDNLQKQKRNEQLKAQGKSDDDIKIIDALENIRKEKAAKNAAYEASKPTSAATRSVGTASEVRKLLSGNTSSAPKLFDTSNLKTLDQKRAEKEAEEIARKQRAEAERNKNWELLKNPNNIFDVINAAGNLIAPDSAKYISAKTGEGIAQGMAEAADTAVGVGNEIGGWFSGKGLGDGFTDYLNSGKTQQDEVAKIGQRIEADRTDNPDSAFVKFLADAGYNVGRMAPSMYASALTGALGVPAKMAKIISGSTIGLNSFTAGTREALKSGASKNEAIAYGALSGIIEGAGEYAIGGVLGKGGGLIDTGLKKLGLNLTKNISNPIVKSLVNYGKNALGEGVEEVIQEAMSVGARKLTYDENAKIDVGELAYAGLLGSLMGGIGSLPSAISNTVSGARTVSEYKEIARDINDVANSGGIEAAKTIADGMKTAWNGQIRAIEANTSYDSEQKELAAAPYKWLVQETDKLTKKLESPELKDAVYSNPSTTEDVKSGEIAKAEAIEKNKAIVNEIRNDSTLTTEEKKSYIDPITEETAKISDLDDVRPDSGEFDDAEEIREAMEEIAAEDKQAAQTEAEEPKVETVKPEIEAVEPEVEEQPLTESTESGTIEANEVPEAVQQPESEPVIEAAEVTETPETVEEVSSSETVQTVEADPIEEVAASEPEIVENASETKQDVSETEQNIPDTEPETFAESRFKNDTLDITAKKHTKTGADLIVGKVNRTLPKEEYAEFLKTVKAAGGYYSKYAGGFVFPNEESLEKMRDVIGINDTRAAVQETAVEQETVTEAAEAPQMAQTAQETTVEAPVSESAPVVETVAEQPQETVQEEAETAEENAEQEDTKPKNPNKPSGISKNAQKIADGIENGISANELNLRKGKVSGFDLEQREYIADALVDGLKTDVNEIHVEVPRDGTLDINNNPESVAHVLDRLGASAPETELTTVQKNAMRYMASKDRLVYAPVGGNTVITDGIVGVVLPKTAADAFVEEHIKVSEANIRAAEIYNNISKAKKIALDRTAQFVNVANWGVCVEISDINGEKYALTESQLNVLNTSKSAELNVSAVNRADSVVAASENGEIVAFSVARPETTIHGEILRTATGSGRTEKVGLPYKKGYFDGTPAEAKISNTTKKEVPQLTDEASPDTTSETVTERTSDNIISQDTENVKSESDSAASQVADFVAGKLAKGEPITRNELNAYAEEVYGKKLADGGIDIKDINDAMELGMNRHILSLKGDYDVNSLLKLTGLLPTQTNRTEDQIKLQQFSTPPAIAYTAAYAANIGKNDVVLEPSAGIGGIAVFAKNEGAKVHVNELDDRRLSIIKELPFDGFYNERGEQLHNILGDKFSPTVVVMNPPFSSSAARNAKDIHEAAKHVESALKLLREGGRLVAITGRGMNMEAPAFRKWWDDIKSEYNVRANIGLDGKNYSKYGTSFDIQLIVIDKNGPTTEDVLKGKVDNVNDLYKMIGDIRNERKEANAVREISGTERNDVRPVVGEKAENEARYDRGTEPQTVEQTPSAADKGSVSEVSDTERSAGTSADTGRSDRKESAESGRRAVGGNESADGRNLDENGRGRSVPTADGESVVGRRDGGMGVLRGEDGELPRSGGRDTEQSGEDNNVERTVKPKEELTEDKYEEYVPQALTVKGAKKHPTKLVESAAMATVKAPEMTEALHIPKKLVTDGILSDAQLEAVTRAWQSFGKSLDNGETQGYFIGDGTGVGKGREIAGIMYESFLRGQDKAVWITKGANLLTDAKRDLGAVIEGETPILQLEGGKKLAKLDKFNKGVLFATYDTVGKEHSKNDSNLNALVNWLGKDFDGVIAFDEAHQMGNATGAKTSRGRSKPAEKAVACIELQRMLPNAKIVYVSATGATEVTNLAYAERLGLWGMGTPFPSQEAFVSKIDAGGVAAMEVVARTLKARGKYIARSLSFEGVNYRRLTHTLDEAQTETYDVAAKAWQVVIQNFNKALEVTGGNLNSKAKSNAAQRIWNSEQQFFEQLTTSMMTPALIEDARKQLEDGKSVVVQLTRTNEAQAERETANAKKNDDGTLDLNETDFSCKGILEELVKNCFPVQEYEVVVDERGNKTSKAVEDSKKNPVLNAEAVRMRDALLAQIGQLTLPDAPIDMIYRGLGEDVVTENTGRKKRFALDENGNTVIVKLPSNKDSFVNDFQDGRKRVMIFSEAGGTGKSYHADKNAKNQQQRIHYLLQPGWKANAAVQGFGRTLRSNQASAPEYVLMTTNVPAQARFISTIARRLDQLGALTKGQSNTGSQGIFSSSDNLEGEYARMSLRTLLSTLDRETLHEMGYDNLYDKQGHLNVSSDHLTNINRFLNRLFVLPLDKQPEVYERFVSEMENRIQIAKDSGKYSDGVENYKAKRVEVNSKTAADIDSDYGTEVDYYVLDAYDDVVFTKFKDIKTKDERFTGFYRTPRGKVRAVFSAGTIVDDKTLNKVNAYSTISVAGRPVRLMQGDISMWTKIDASEAETLWKEETAEHPKEAKTELHVVAGDLLHVWNQLPDTNISFKRILLKGGETIIGRVIPKKELDSTLRALNLDGKKRKYTAADAVKALGDGGFVQMAGGMRIERKRVANEYRYEFSGRIAPWQMTTIKNQYDLFSENIQSINRYFIPTDKAESIIEKLSKSYPIQEVYSAKEADAEYSLAHENLQTDDEYVQELIDNVISPMGIKVVFDKADTETDSAEYSIDTITDNNNVSYGVGVKLDSVLLDKLSPEERIKAVKERIKSIGGQSFVAYDSNKNASNIIIAESSRKFINKSGKKVPVNKDMTSYLDSTVKQESLVLVDELITTSSYKGSEPARHPHGWLDNDGKNSWEVWETYVQDKNNTVWKATLRVANSANGEKILYDVFPIEKAAGVRTSDTATANPIIPQNTDLSSAANKKIQSAEAMGQNQSQLNQQSVSDTIIPQNFNLSSTSGGETIRSLAYYDSETRTIHVVGNPPSLTTLLAHELYHALSKEDQARLAYFFRTNSDTNSAEFKAWKQEITELYSKKYAETGREFTEADFWREYAAMSCESLFTDKQLVEHLCGKSKTLGQRILDWIKNAWYAITGRSRYTTNRAVEAGKLTEKALRKAALLYSDALGVKLNLVEQQIVKSSVPEAIASDIGFGDDVGGINYSIEAGADITDTPPENTGNVTMEQFNEDFENAKVVPKSDPWYTKGKNALGEMFAKLTRADSLIPESGADGVYYAPLRRQIIRIRDNFVRSQSTSLADIMGMMTYTDEKGKRKALSKGEADKFTRLVYLNDLAETAKIQRERGEDVRLPKEYSEEDVHKLHDELMSSLTDTERAHINEALDKRAAVWKQLTSDYIKYNRMCGFDVSNRISRQAYYRHQVIDFMVDPQAHEKRYGKVAGMHLNDGRSFLKRRTGSERDINTDFASVEFLSLQQMHFDTEVAKALAKIKTKYDMKPEFVKRAKAENREAIDNLILREAREAMAADMRAKGKTVKDEDIDSLEPLMTVKNGKARYVSDTYEQIMQYNRGMARSMSQLTQLALDGELDGYATTSGHRLALEQLKRGMMNESTFDFMSEFVSENDNEAAIAARVFFKNSALKRQFVEDKLGDKYMTWEKIAKSEGYVIFQPREGRYSYNTNALDESAAKKLAEQIAATVAKDEAVNLSTEEWNAIISTYAKQIRVMGQPYEQWAVKPLITQVLSKNAMEAIAAKVNSNSFVNIYLNALRHWKGWVTAGNPLRAIKYHARNIIGDLEAAFTADPGIMRMVPKAFGEIKDMLTSGKETDTYREWLELGGDTNLIGIQEMTETERRKYLPMFAEDLSTPKKVIAAVTKPLDTLSKYGEDLNRARESLLRYASYLYYKDKLTKSGGRVTDYVASNRNIINGLDTIEEKAYQLSADALGNYADISEFGRQIRRGLIPFYSFTESNMRRYYRFFANPIISIAKGDNRAQNVGNLAKRMATPAAGAVILALINGVLNREADEKLPEDVRNRPHITFGEWGGNVYAFTRVGNIMEPLEWVGLDDVAIVDGKIEGLTDENVFVAGLNKLYNSVTPVAKLFIELPTGFSFYNGFDEPSIVRDKWEHFFNTFGLSDVYKLVRGKPVKNNNLTDIIQNAVVYKYDTLESAYWDTINNVNNWKGSEGTLRKPEPHQLALYYAKQAIRYGEADKAKKYVKEFFKLGGTGSGIVSSISSMNPYWGMTSDESKEKRKAFEDSLSAVDYEKLQSAVYYYETFLEIPEAYKKKLRKADNATAEALMNIYIDYVIGAQKAAGRK